MIHWTTDTGVEFKIENEWDFLVFADVFINRNYQLFMGNPLPRKAEIVDIGANVGYFSLYAAHECRKVGQEYHIHAFEAVASTFDILNDRIALAGIPATLHYGAVGKKSGTAWLAESANHSTSFLVGDRYNEFEAKPVPYRDLDVIIPGHVDILKCDIEGSEYDFVESYPTLLGRTDIVYMEVHHTVGDSAKLRKQMESYGFTKHKVTVNHKDTTVEVFARG